MKLLRAFFLAASLSVILLCSCEATPEEYEGEPNIYAVLSADSSFACTMVGLTLSIDDTMKVDTIMDTFWYDDTFEVWPRIIFPWNGVSGAEVTLKTGQQSFLLEEREDSTGYYYLDSVEISRLQTWGLEVTYPDGTVIKAATTIPGGFEITSPVGDSVSSADTVVWTASTGAAGYAVGAFEWYSWGEEDTLVVDSDFYFFNVLLPADTCFFDLSQTGIGWVDSARFYVAALDSNAFDYRYFTMFSEWYNLRPEDYMHIPGAWGVFGSQTVERSKVFIVRHDTIFPH